MHQHLRQKIRKQILISRNQIQRIRVLLMKIRKLPIQIKPVLNLQRNQVASLFPGHLANQKEKEREDKMYGVALFRIAL